MSLSKRSYLARLAVYWDKGDECREREPHKEYPHYQSTYTRANVRTREEGDRRDRGDANRRRKNLLPTRRSESFTAD